MLRLKVQGGMINETETIKINKGEADGRGSARPTQVAPRGATE